MNERLILLVLALNIGLWLLYYLGSRALRALPEERFLKVLYTFSGLLTNKHQLLGLLPAVFIVPLSVWFFVYLANVSRLYMLPGAYFFSTESSYYLSMWAGVMSGLTFFASSLWITRLFRNPDWDKKRILPSLEEAKRFQKRGKVAFLFLCLLAEFLFIMALSHFHASFHDRTVRSSTFGLKIQTFEAKDLQLQLSLEGRYRSSPKSSKRTYERYPNCLLIYPDGKEVNILERYVYKKDYDALLACIERLYANGMKLKVKELGIFDRAKLRDEKNEKLFEHLDHFFTEMNSLQKGISYPFGIGSSAVLNEGIITVTNFKKNPDGGIFKETPEKEYLSVYFSVENTGSDTLLFRSATGFKLFDATETTYVRSMMAKDSMNGFIPPLSTSTGHITFFVERDHPPYRLEYQNSFLKKEKLVFDLGEAK